MINQRALSQGIFFKICEPVTSQVVSWRRDVDEAMMRYQLSRSSQILVLGLQGQGFIHVSELPERGTAIPNYGIIGGGFEFVYHPTGEQTEITVNAMFSEHPIFFPDPIEPLKLTTPGIFHNQAMVYEHVGTTGPDDKLVYSPEFLFGFYGKCMDMYSNWEWYSEDIKKFDFSFVPSSIGTAAAIIHRESGTVLDLTRDANW